MRNQKRNLQNQTFLERRKTVKMKLVKGSDLLTEEEEEPGVEAEVALKEEVSLDLPTKLYIALTLELKGKQRNVFDLCIGHVSNPGDN